MTADCVDGDCGACMIAAPEPSPKYTRLNCPSGECNWSETSYAALKSLIENSLGQDDQALTMIAILERPP